MATPPEAPFQLKRMQIKADKVMKIPGPDHSSSIEANPSRVVVEVGGVYARWDNFDLRREMTTTLERELRRIMGIGAPKARAA